MLEAVLSKYKRDCRSAMVFFIVANIKQSNGMRSRSVLCIYMSASGHVAFGECTLASLGAISNSRLIPMSSKELKKRLL